MINLKTVISDNEKIIWEGKPNKKCFILESIFNPMLPFALLWAGFDIFAIGLSFDGSGFGFMIFGFLLLHMMPVWIYLGGVILAFRKYNNTQYIVTDLGLYVSGGAFRYSYDMKPWAELSNISIERGIFDQRLGVGDVVFYGDTIQRANGKSYTQSMSIINIPDYEEVFKLTKNLQRDIHSDTMYPNDLRPEENHGYKTKYNK